MTKYEILDLIMSGISIILSGIVLGKVIKIKKNIKTGDSSQNVEGNFTQTSKGNKTINAARDVVITK